MTVFEKLPKPATVEEMEKEIRGQQADPTIRELYPALTEPAVREAEVNLRRYFEITTEIQHEQALDAPGFDTSGDVATMRERSNANLKS